MKLLICFGTRPEFIKIKSLLNHLNPIQFKTCFIEQHNLQTMNISCHIDYHLKIHRYQHNDRLNTIIASVCSQFNSILQQSQCSHILIQGDTTTALAVAIAGYNLKIPIIHLEAGLRSGTIASPFPEEANRQLISRIASIHLCPTALSRNNLIREHVNHIDQCFIVGNTVLDTLPKNTLTYYGHIIIVTLHRRDNLAMIAEWFTNLNNIAQCHPELQFVLPIHPHPIITKHRKLLQHILVIDPMPHEQFITLLASCKFVISDSGGIQEEASFYNKRIIICRESTERPEVLDSGHGILCKSPTQLKHLFNKINANYVINKPCPFGNGKSYELIIEKLFNPLRSS